MRASDDRLTERGADMPRQALGWYAGWIVPTVIATVGLATLEFWLPAPFPETRTALMRIIDSDHGILCQKFGIEPLSEQFSACKADLRELRNHDASMVIFL